MSKKVHWRSALIGGLVAGLVITAAPVVADVGEAMISGVNNTADARTNLTGSVQSANLRLTNTHPDGTALSLSVEPGNPPFKVGSRTAVKKLHADKLDDLSAHQILRAAHAGSANLPDMEGAVLSVDVVAPFDGFLYISGGFVPGQSTADGTFVSCWFDVDGQTAVGSERTFTHGIISGAVWYSSCNSSVMVPVTAGTHTVDLIHSINSSIDSVDDGSLTALYVPFDGEGKKP